MKESPSRGLKGTTKRKRKKQGTLEKWLTELGQGKYKMSLEQPVVPEYKKVRHVKKHLKGLEGAPTGNI